MKERSKQFSVEELVDLPSKRPLILEKQSIFQLPEFTNEEALLMTPKIKKLRSDLFGQMNQQLMVYENTAYNFKFPESKFPDIPENQRNNMTYQQKIEVEQEDTFANKLSELQLAQIKQKGEFQVRSKSEKATIPYVWKINGCMFRGRVKRLDAWQEGLSRCYRLMNFALDSLAEVVPRDLKKLANLPVKFFSLIFGRKKLQLIYTPDYQRQVYKQFWEDIMNNQLSNIKNQIGHQFLQKLYLKYEPALYQTLQSNQNNYQQLQKARQEKIKVYNQNKNKINQYKNVLTSIDVKFQNNWAKIRKNVIGRVVTQVDQRSQKMISIENDEEPLAAELLKKKDQTIIQRFHHQKYLIYVAHVKQSLGKQNIEADVSQAILTLISIFSLISFKITSKAERLTQIQQKIRSNIKRRHPIRSRSDKFISRSVHKYYQPVKQQIQQQFDNQLLTDKKLLENLNPNYVSIFQKYIKLKQNFNALVEQKKESMKCLFEPQRVFRTTYILFPPYDVNYIGGYHYLKKKQQLRIDTSTNFWKCSLYFMRLKSWSINCFKFLVGVCWASPLGLRCLFGVGPFVYDQNIDSRTGFKTQITQVPFLGRFGKVLRGIKKSRNAFEALPDRGLFGKNCSRICNYLQCYLFRFIFVGLIGVLMLYPIAIIIFSVICFVAILTVWIWVPICMVLCYLFNILVFQFQISYKPAGCLIKSIPLLCLVLLILFYILRILFFVLFLILIAPIACFFLFLFTVFQRGMRFFTDTVMLCLMGCLGRTPSRDTSIARKVSGPGMSRNYFYSISEQDVYILTQAALEKIHAQKFIALTRKKILQNTKKYSLMCTFILKPFGHSTPIMNTKKDLITTNTQQLLNNFNRKAQQYMLRYPNNPRNIRFTQQEIQLYFLNCVKIVKKFVETKKIQQWVFEEKNILFEDYEELTRYIWMQIFNCGEQIFQPIQTIDNRFKLLDDQGDNSDMLMKQKKGSIMKALEGEIDLQQKIPTFTPAKKSLLTHDRAFYFMQQICSTQQNNSDLYLTTSFENPNFLLCSPRNLQDLKAYQNYNKERLLKSKTKIIEQ